MTFLSRHVRHALLLLATVGSLLTPVAAAAQSASTQKTFSLPVTETMVLLAPHCIEEDRTRCTMFDTLDPKRLSTAPVRMGDILDVDVVVQSPSPQTIHTVRAWLQYNPTSIEVRSVELLSALPEAIPGEAAFDATRGVIKIGGGNSAGLSGQNVAVARITFRVLSIAEPTELTFLNYKKENTGETAILGENESPLLNVEPPRLVVRGAGTAPLPYELPPVTNTSSSSMAMPAGTGVTLPQPATNGLFGSLQVSGVRVTSQGDSLFIGWNPLPAPDIAGYNVYYGTVSGRYIQRRSLPTTSRSLAIRSLEVGTQYFVAIRAYNQSMSESAFSQEASVVIGRPETSTSPLSASEIESGPDGNPVVTHGGNQVVGESGLSFMVVLIGLFAAAAGTALAWRRQLVSHPVSGS